MATVEPPGSTWRVSSSHWAPSHFAEMELANSRSYFRPTAVCSASLSHWLPPESPPMICSTWLSFAWLSWGVDQQWWQRLALTEMPVGLHPDCVANWGLKTGWWTWEWNWSLEPGQDQQSGGGHPVGFSLSCRWHQWVIGTFWGLSLPAQSVDRCLATQPPVTAGANMSSSQCTWPVFPRLLPGQWGFSRHLYTQNEQK